MDRNTKIVTLRALDCYINVQRENEAIARHVEEDEGNAKSYAHCVAEARAARAVIEATPTVEAVDAEVEQ